MLSEDKKYVDYLYNDLLRKIRRKQVSYGDVSLSGTATHILGVDSSTGDIYYKDSSGNWQLANSGGGGGSTVYLSSTDFNGDGATIGTAYSIDRSINQTFTGIQSISKLVNTDFLNFVNSANSNTVKLFLPTPIGGGVDFAISATGGRINLSDCYAVRLPSVLETPSGLGLNMAGNGFNVDAAGDIQFRTNVANINILHGGYNKSTELNSYTGFPLLINAGTTDNGNGRVLIGTATDNTVDKLQVNGTILGTFIKGNGSALTGITQSQISQSIQSISSGSTALVLDTTTIFLVDPSSALSTLTITLPAIPTNGKRIDFIFGGTIAATSTTVVTNLIFLANTGHGLVGNGTIGLVNTEDHVSYVFISSISKWFKL